jgi:hypothetical protein
MTFKKTEFLKMISTVDVRYAYYIYYYAQLTPSNSAIGISFISIKLNMRNTLTPTTRLCVAPYYLRKYDFAYYSGN